MNQTTSTSAASSIGTTMPAATSGLQRRLQLSVPMAEVEKEAQKRLIRISKTVKMPGFRPGKVPMKVVSQNYGAQAQSEAIGDVVSRAYSSAVVAQNLRVAGSPSIEPVTGGSDSDQELKFEAIVEVYPEIAIPDLSAVEIKKTVCDVTDADLERTLETLRKQRTDFVNVDRASEKGDRVTVDFKGEIDGVAFTGGTSENYSFVLGDGSMLKEFDQAALGMRTEETKTFPLKFPEDYHGKDVAGKLAMFTIKIRAVSEPKVPELDEAFARSMGIASGDLNQFREDVRKNLLREVAGRCKAKTKSAVMEALDKFATFEVPSALIENESQRMAESMRADMAARGMNVKEAPIPAELFKEQAVKRVRIGLLVGEIVKTQDLKATDVQIRTLVQEMSSAYEKPEAFVNWFMGQPRQRAEAEALVIEENVVNWVMSRAKVVDHSVAVEGLMTDQA